MKKILFLILAFAASAAFSQTHSTLYAALEKSYSGENYEACLQHEAELTRFATQESDSIAMCMSMIGESHYQVGNLESAIEWYERERTLREKLQQQGTDPFSQVLYSLTSAYFENGNYDKAVALAELLIKNDEKLYPPSSEDFVSSVLSVIPIYVQLDQFDKAEKLLTATLKHQDENPTFKGILLTKLGDLYTLTSQYSRATKTLNKALITLHASDGPGSDHYISAAIAMGILQMSQGKFPEAEETFDHALSHLTEGDEAWFPVLNNQAIVYQSLGQLDRAEKLFIAIKKQDSVSLGTEHPDYALTLNNLGLLYSDQGNYAKAEEVLQESLRIQKANDGGSTVTYARKLNNMARLYRLKGNLSASRPLLEEALLIYKQKLGAKSTEYATTTLNLAMVQWKLGDTKAAKKLLKECISIRAAKLGKQHPKYTEAVEKLAEWQWEQKQWKEARVGFNEVFENHLFQIRETFPVLTEEEKAKFYYTNIKPSLEKFNAFALTAQKTDPSIAGDAFNHHLNTKSLIFYATERLRAAIHDSRDPVLIHQFEEWEAKKEQIAKFYSQNQTSEVLQGLKAEADALEKDIARKSAAFTAAFSRKRIVWQDIQKALPPGTAAVEIVRHRDYVPTRGGELKENIHYLLLIVSSRTTTAPDIIDLGNGKDLEGRNLKYYRNHVRSLMDDEVSYSVYAKELVEYCKRNDITRIFLSPDGVYNQISLNTLKNPTTDTFLVDELDIRQVTSARDLLEPSPKATYQSSLLIGFPKFNIGSDSSKARNADGLASGNLSRGLRGGLLRQLRGEAGISELPGTAVEVSRIAQLAPQPEVFTESLAAEMLIKQVISPGILHIATHGYFLQEETENLSAENAPAFVPNPLLKSGLLLAGAENFLRTGVPANAEGEDGILTAYEAMNLNLEGTHLVVLSACETGLGEVQNGEGVYGLQRALKLAGAKNIIMSLWQVDDAATQELMSTFYEAQATESDLPKAFRIAQQRLKEKYQEPFYWGAFVMIGI